MKKKIKSNNDWENVADIKRNKNKKCLFSILYLLIRLTGTELHRLIAVNNNNVSLVFIFNKLQRTLRWSFSFYIDAKIS